MSDVTDTSLGIEAHERRGLLADFFIRLVREKPLGTAGGLVVLVLLFAGIFADVLAPYPYAEIHLESILEGPSDQYLLGTDQLGRDVLSRIIYGARVSVIVGLSATTISVLGATALGGLCGFLGGKLDLIVQRFVDAWMAFPGLLVLLTIMSVVGRGVPQLILVLGIIGWFGGSRVSRSAVIGIKENMYVTAAKSIGSPAWRTVIRHVLPNIMAPVIIMFTTGIGGVILAEASLSFLGYGLPPDVPSWGGMLSGEGRRFMEMAPRLALWPGFCLSIVVYGTNMFGDALRDLLDPRLRGGVGRMGAYGAKSVKKAIRGTRQHQPKNNDQLNQVDRVGVEPTSAASQPGRSGRGARMQTSPTRTAAPWSGQQPAELPRPSGSASAFVPTTAAGRPRTHGSAPERPESVP